MAAPKRTPPADRWQPKRVRAQADETELPPLPPLDDDDQEGPSLSELEPSSLLSKLDEGDDDATVDDDLVSSLNLWSTEESSDDDQVEASLESDDFADLLLQSADATGTDHEGPEGNESHGSHLQLPDEAPTGSDEEHHDQFVEDDGPILLDLPPLAKDPSEDGDSS